MGRLLSGVHQLGVRWYTVSDSTSSARTGTTWTPLDDVPTTATRLPAKSTGSEGQSPVWWASPAKDSRPGTSGMYGIERTPVAATTNRAVTAGPTAVTTCHVPVPLS